MAVREALPDSSYTPTILVALGSWSSSLRANVLGFWSETFYQPLPFCAFSAVIVLSPLGITLDEPLGLFFATVLRIEGGSRYSYSRAWNMERLRRSAIWLPMKGRDEPDLEYMRALTHASEFAPAEEPWGT